jgi:rubrerythrin
MAWDGLVSKSEIDQGIYLMEGDEKPEQVIALAYGLEAATQRFYEDLATRTRDTETKGAFARLAQDEVYHKDRLWERYLSLSGSRENRQAFEDGIVAETLEHGKTADQILSEHPDWIGEPREALELALSLETDSLDLYLRMAEKSKEKETAAVFYDLAGEEKKHLKGVGELFRNTLKSGRVS